MALAGCGDHASSGTVPPGPDDAAIADAEEPADAAPAPDGPPPLRRESAWLARDFMTGDSVNVPMLAIEAVLRRNAAGDPPEGRLIFLVHTQDLSDTEAQLTFGVGEVAELAADGSEVYRFRQDPAPTTMPVRRGLPSDDTIFSYSAGHVSISFSIPLYPGGSDPPSQYAGVPCHPEDQSDCLGAPWVFFQYPQSEASPFFELIGYEITPEVACPVSIDGVNLLDVLDGRPTAGIDGTESSVDCTTYACHGANCLYDSSGKCGRPWFFYFRIIAFDPVTVVLDQ